MSITWSATADPGRSVKAVCSTNNEAFAQAATDGALLDIVDSLEVHLSADVGQTLSATGSLTCWKYNAAAKRWSRFKEWDIALSSTNVDNTQRDATFIMSSAGLGQPIIYKGGRVAWVPATVGVSGGGVTIWINCATSQYGAL